MFSRLLVFCLLIWVPSVLNPNKKTGVMRKINLIVIHCTATREDKRLSEEALNTYHRSLGYNGCGYHYYIRRDGNIVTMRPLARVGAHVRGYNLHSIGIAYEGGLDALGKPKDTRTAKQRISLQVLVAALLKSFPNSIVLGHRDLSTDTNGDGEISPDEWIKSCPCFDVRTDL